MSNNIRVRIAPSPTGNLHIGTARTALFNYLFAKHNNGKFILRIEDTDLERSDKKYEKDIFDGLNWLGIEADESPEKGGPYSPYRQSERTDTYKKYIEKLLREGKVFYCFHTEEELENEKQKLIEEKKPQLHFCEFRTMDIKEAEALKDIKTNYIIRFKTPAGKTIKFNDLIRGEVSFESDFLGDFSIAKNVETPLYNFAVVIDDEEMKISHVIRGEDHISNTPKQILIAEALGFDLPQYAHLPLILGEDRSKLSKRHGATSVEEYKKYYPEALFNFLALLGWNPGGDKEIFTKNELIKEFSLEKTQKSGAIFDVKKLEWLNGEYHKKYLEERGSEEIAEYIKKEVPQYLIRDIATTAQAIKLEGSRMRDFTALRDSIIEKAEDYDADLLIWKDMTNKEILEAFGKAEKIISDLSDFAKGQIETSFLEAIGDSDKGKILWPLRVALSGKKASPGPFEIMEVLGKEESLKRIEFAKSKLAQ